MSQDTSNATTPSSAADSGGSSGGSIMPSDASLLKLRQQIMNRMIRSGEWQATQLELRDRLDEAGWTDSVRGVAREKARAQQELDFPALQDDVAKYALDSLPQAVKSELLASVRKYVESQVEADDARAAQQQQGGQ